MHATARRLDRVAIGLVICHGAQSLHLQCLVIDAASLVARRHVDRHDHRACTRRVDVYRIGTVHVGVTGHLCGCDGRCLGSLEHFGLARLLLLLLLKG